MTNKNGEFKVEKGIKIPEPKRGAVSRYPWASLGIGDSFFVDGKSSRHMGVLTFSRGQRDGRKYAVRTEGTGSRIWRIK